MHNLHLLTKWHCSPKLILLLLCIGYIFTYFHFSLDRKFYRLIILVANTTVSKHWKISLCYDTFLRQARRSFNAILQYCIWPHHKAECSVSDFWYSRGTVELREWKWQLENHVYVRHTFSSGLHAAGDVDRVTKETVPRHRDSNYSSDHWATV